MTDVLIPLFSLIALEVILGIDNIIFISILADILPEHQRNKQRYWGIGLAFRVFGFYFVDIEIGSNLIHPLAN